MDPDDLDPSQHDGDDAAQRRGSWGTREIALSQTGASLHEVIDAVADAVIATDQNGRIVLWNQTAERLYGWSESEVIGHSIVELLAPAGTRDRGEDLLDSLRLRGHLGSDHRLVAKSGHGVDIHAATRAIANEDGDVRALVGVSRDISALRQARATAATLSAQLQSALHTETRRALLAEATSDLAVSLSVSGSLQRLARLVVPELADWVIIDLADQHSHPVQVAMLHRDGMAGVVERFSKLQPAAMTDQAPIMRVLATGEPILVSETSIAAATTYVSDPELLELCDQLGICSVMYIPLAARGRILGCITLVAGVSGRHYTHEDLDFAVGLAQRAALVVDNSSLYEREHRVAQVLQESLLPSLPGVSDIDLAAVYRPGDLGALVGGDFYDVLTLPGDRLGLAVGDVVGHDLAAAATMGQLRGLLRACAWEGMGDGPTAPGDVLDRVDRLVQGLELTRMATVFYAETERWNGSGDWVLRYATAGHPLPLMRHPDGSVTEMNGRGLALGVSPHPTRRSFEVAVPAGSILVAFTDGLVERRDCTWDESMEQVRTALAALPRDMAAKSIAEHLLGTVGGARSDDIAILVARFSAPH